jgi:hypothetical protein
MAAASLLVLAAVGYLLLENSRLRNSVSATQAERATLQQREQELLKQLDEQRSADADLSRELERVRGSLARVEQRLPANQQGNEGKSHLQGFVSLVLSPQTRGGAPVAEIVLQRTTEYVAVELKLESDDFPDYRVALKNPATNHVMWQSARLKTGLKGESKTVIFRLPASLLKPQNYSLELNGIPAGRPAEIITSYPFKVVLQ